MHQRCGSSLSCCARYSISFTAVGSSGSFSPLGSPTEMSSTGPPPTHSPFRWIGPPLTTPPDGADRSERIRATATAPFLVLNENPKSQNPNPKTQDETAQPE